MEIQVIEKTNGRINRVTGTTIKRWYDKWRLLLLFWKSDERVTQNYNIGRRFKYGNIKRL